MSTEGGSAAPLAIWGELGTDFDDATLTQMNRARGLPITRAAALMPDAHVGYGLPIGGVLATHNAVIPYAVGVDIACRMKLSVLDLPAADLAKPAVRDRLARALTVETRFGVGAEHERPEDHPVLAADWTVSPITQRWRDRAVKQLGTSGSGNHFVEFGTLTVMGSGLTSAAAAKASAADVGLPPGTYVALLSHSGSRGTGAQVCSHYSKLAQSLHPDLPRQARELAWLDMDSDPGREYWAAMELMGEYASANHAVIHRRLVKHLGVGVLAGVENHHNFAWRERHMIDGTPTDVIVHRKGATPAAPGVLGVIPGSMAAPGFVVRGKAGAAALGSASHGAGRAMSRNAARSRFTFGGVRKELAAREITVLSAGADEAPGAYKDIHRVMALQQDLVEVIARFDPAIVKMAPEGERAED